MNIVYFPCSKHFGIPWQSTTQIPAVPTRTVCPICEPPAPDLYDHADGGRYEVLSRELKVQFDGTWYGPFVLYKSVLNGQLYGRLEMDGPTPFNGRFKKVEG